MLYTILLLILTFNFIKCHSMLKPCSLKLKKCLKYRFAESLNSYVCYQCESAQCPCKLSLHKIGTYKLSRNFPNYNLTSRNYWLSATIGIFLLIVLIIFILIIIYFIQFYLKKRRRFIVNNSGLSRTHNVNSSRVWFTNNSDSSPPNYNNVKLDTKNSNSTDFLPPYAAIN